MIKKFSIFENFYEEEDEEDDIIEFYKGEIVLRPNYAAISDGLFLLLQDVTQNDRLIKVIFIGIISSNVYNVKYASFIFNRDNNEICNIYNNKNFISFRKLNSEETRLIYEAINSGKYHEYLNIIEEKTGINIVNTLL